MWKNLLIHLWFVGALVLIVWLGSERGATKTFECRKNSRFRIFLLPGPLAEKKNWIKFQRAVSFVAVPLLILIYLVWFVLK